MKLLIYIDSQPKWGIGVNDRTELKNLDEKIRLDCNLGKDDKYLIELK